MLQSVVIGNLGADVEFHSEQGSEYITFKVAHSERYPDAQGKQVEQTVWISCVMNGRADKLRPYLVKGQKVCVIGDTSVRTYHSKKMQRLVAGCNLFVRSIELVGGRGDDVPRYLFNEDGVQHNVSKHYYCDTAKGHILYDKSGVAYQVDKKGWVTLVENTQDSNQEQADE